MSLIRARARHLPHYMATGTQCTLCVRGSNQFQNAYIYISPYLLCECIAASFLEIVLILFDCDALMLLCLTRCAVFYLQKPKVVSVPWNDILPSPTTKVEAKPVEPSCSQLKQSCLPQFGCCDPRASCHCRFFNAICICRRTG